MKRFVAICCLCLLAAFVALPAQAAKNAPQQAQVVQDPAAHQKFLADTAATRQELAVKRAEYQALMQGQNPDRAAAAALAKDIFTLREKLRAQAVDQGFGPGNCPGYGGRGAGGCGGGGCGGGMGMGRGMGW
ncbi:hypothetical protein NNJEOMEG_01879 [Fundidesulfovibrio magnetotacticus]|uniref:Zinc resistance-associated protein n=1 Tax=Fundidesulfovibrio magnetotacticus TaxID=2730080 RepID=A0A6V8LTX3_9BACT|nr:hypothetical protein [Fundidesulfovibrio magnetotacticus]GFK94041.1 hypothetical protein NNJEOMEG_01879 [Fundidesulfovibrio magnetotacticus]